MNRLSTNNKLIIFILTIFIMHSNLNGTDMLIISNHLESMIEIKIFTQEKTQTGKIEIQNLRLFPKERRVLYLDNKYFTEYHVTDFKEKIQLAQHPSKYLLSFKTNHNNIVFRYLESRPIEWDAHCPRARTSSEHFEY